MAFLASANPNFQCAPITRHSPLEKWGFIGTQSSLSKYSKATASNSYQEADKVLFLSLNTKGPFFFRNGRHHQLISKIYH